MATLSSRLVVSLVDNASRSAARIARSFGAMKAAGASAVGAMGGQATALQTHGRRFNAAARRMGGASSAGSYGATFAAAGFLANEVAVQEAMNRTQAILNETSRRFQDHRDLVIELAKTWPATSREIAEGASELAMAGMSMEQVNEVLEATVQGAMASGESIKTVGMGVTAVANALGKSLTKENFEEINNILAAGATSYPQDYSQFLAGLGKAAPLARVTGTSLENMVGMLGVLAGANFQAEKGGTALRTMMIKMGAPTNKGRAQLEKYGIALEEFRGKLDRTAIGGAAGAENLRRMLAESGIYYDLTDAAIRGVLDDKSLDSTALRQALASRIAQSLEASGAVVQTEELQEAVGAFVASGFSRLDVVGLFKRLGEAGAADDLQALADIFGLRFSAQGSMLASSLFQVDPLTGKTPFDAKFDTLMQRVPNAVERFAKILMQGLPGAVKRLASAFDGFLRTLAKSGAIDTVVMALERLRDGINWLGETSPPILKALTLALLGLGVIAPISLLLGALGGALSMLTAAGSLLGVTLTAVGAGLLALGWWAAPVVAAIAAGASFIIQNWEGFVAFFQGVGEGFMTALEPVKPLIDDILWLLGGVAQAVISVTGPLDESGDSWRAWGRLVGEVIGAPLRMLGELHQAIKDVTSLLPGGELTQASAARLAGEAKAFQSGGVGGLIGHMTGADAALASWWGGGGTTSAQPDPIDIGALRAASAASAPSVAPGGDVTVTVNVAPEQAHDPAEIGAAVGAEVRRAVRGGYSDGSL